ncbi:hypothetical protein [Francisella frigiditurris]|uniref:Putative lipoprotein n=1 Tax=Francisella frigiditurris TaxID=1542390 RepID=A0A1J0KVB8_9GAMM|nr:hypothetical protein [Francisella frigiditurris]APC97733.1 putative lipoprotein [Francisella frigiditurris]
MKNFFIVLLYITTLSSCATQPYSAYNFNYPVNQGNTCFNNTYARYMYSGDEGMYSSSAEIGPLTAPGGVALEY